MQKRMIIPPSFKEREMRLVLNGLCSQSTSVFISGHALLRLSQTNPVPYLSYSSSVFLLQGLVQLIIHKLVGAGNTEPLTETNITELKVIRNRLIENRTNRKSGAVFFFFLVCVCACTVNRNNRNIHIFMYLQLLYLRFMHLMFYASIS